MAAHSAPAEPDATAIREALERLVKSKTLASSKRLVRFLRFAVEQTLAGNADLLKEYTIGVEVYDRRESYDPRIDSIVRVEARRLRAKLKRYYETEGKLESIRITLEEGGYVPQFGPHREEVPKTAVKSIAVLPFQARTPDPEAEIFADGITEELIHSLTRTRDLNVVARTSAFQFKGKNYDIREVGEKLSVNYVLEGSLRKAGDKIRVSVQLIGVADGYQLWSQSFDRQWSDVFALEEEIARTIADKLRLALSISRRTASALPSIADLESYTLYLKGRFYWNKKTAEGFAKAIECFEQAIAANPLDARAYTGLADCYISMSYWGSLATREGLAKGRAYTLKALEFDPDSVEALTTRAAQLAFFEWQWSEAEALFERAIRGARYATAHHWYAGLLTARGRFTDAISQMQRALRLDPLNLDINTSLGMIYSAAREYERAVGQYRKTIELDRHYCDVWTELGITSTRLRRFDDAFAAFESARLLGG
ncbi:MAG: tetratricopeptide repeat protein, partial [Bryobacter sp.]|nr:tetratricopeptide repeat protein [Bryobacter sp.]